MDNLLPTLIKIDLVIMTFWTAFLFTVPVF